MSAQEISKQQAVDLLMATNRANNGRGVGTPDTLAGQPVPVAQAIDYAVKYGQRFIVHSRSGVSLLEVRGAHGAQSFYVRES